MQGSSLEDAMARLTDPGLPGEPFMIGLADRTEGARKEHRNLPKPVLIHLDASGNSAARVGAFDHDHAHLVAPLFGFISVSVCRPRDCTSSSWWRRPFQPLRRLAKASGCFLQHPAEALPERLGRRGRDLLGDLPKLPVLHERCFESLAALRR